MYWQLSSSAVEVIFGWVIPLDVKLPIAIIYNHNFQFQYQTVDNSSQVSYVLSGGRSIHRSKRAVITRNHVYDILEKLMEKNQVNKECLLRAICETRTFPLAHNGIFGEIMEHVLRPRSKSSEDSYSKAWQLGSQDIDCKTYYSLCPHGHSILDEITYYK
uniref:Uncharacterized protein n=1 Tax=Clastoptera arizonana TaxID=38151 RepID=A0A1B6CSL9_9HEMI